MVPNITHISAWIKWISRIYSLYWGPNVKGYCALYTSIQAKKDIFRKTTENYMTNASQYLPYAHVCIRPVFGSLWVLPQNMHKAWFWQSYTRDSLKFYVTYEHICSCKLHHYSLHLLWAKTNTVSVMIILFHIRHTECRRKETMHWKSQHHVCVSYPIITSRCVYSQDPLGSTVNSDIDNSNGVTTQ